MTDYEIDKYVQDMKEFSKRISSSKEESIKFLTSTGIYDKNGRLTEHYRSGK